MRKEMTRCVGLSAEKLKNDEFWKRRIKFSKNFDGKNVRNYLGWIWNEGCKKKKN